MNFTVIPNLQFKGFFILLLVSLCSFVYAQNQTAKVTPNNTFYWEYLPPDYHTTTTKYPVVFFLHGLGERGDTEADLVNVAKNGPPKHVKNGYKFPFILISPQLKKNKTGWPNTYIDEVIEYCKTYLRIDLSRVYLTGLSLGGGGTWGYSQDAILGQKLAAVAVICGSSNNTGKACSFGLTNLPVWAFHGDADGTVSVNKTINMVKAINACIPAPDPLAKMTIYPGVNHNSWDRAYLTDNSLHTPNVYQWLMQFKNDGLVVNAGADRTINLPTNTATLAGTASIPNATVTSYTWTKVSGPSVTMTNTSTPTLSVANLLEGIYTFRLAATSSNGETAYDDIKITVVQLNQSPTANAGADRTITLPTNSLTINGTGSDPDGSIASYAWAKVSGPTATLSGTTTANLSLANLVEGTYIFRLTVTDNSGATGTDQVQITVNPAAVNQAPSANAGTDKTLNLPLNSITLSGTANDPDGTVVSYAWEKVSGPAATLSNAATANLSLTNLVAGVYVFRLIATDNAGATGTDELTLTVIEANQAPSANAGTDITLTLPTNSTNLNGSGSDPDGTITSYSWTLVSGPSSPTLTNASAAVASVNNLIEGTYIFRLTVVDDKSASGIDEVRVIVNPAIVNTLPVANAGGDKTVNLPTNSATLNGSGSDADGSIVSYSWVKVSGSTVTLTNAGTPNLSLTNLQAGVYRFELTVTDNQGGTAADVATITVVAANQSPVANAGSDISIALPTSTVTITGSGSDADGTVTGYAWVQVSGPSSATIGNPAGAATMVSDLAEGTYTFMLTVTDNAGATGSDEVKITVSPENTNAAPVASAGPDRTITLPVSSIVLNGSGSDVDGTISSYQWIRVSGAACILSGENTASLSVSGMVAGVYRFRLTVTDDDGATHSDDAFVTVQPEEVNQTPVANAGANISLKLPINSTTISGIASDPDGTIVTYLWEKMSGPSATMSGENTTTLQLTNLVDGNYVFEFTVTDDKGATASDLVEVNVSSQNINPVANAAQDVTITLPENSATIMGSGTDADGTIVSYSWTQVSGPSTATMTIANTASILVADLIEGTYVFNLEVTDNDGGTGSDQIKVIVNAGNQAPSVTINTNRNITLPMNKTTFTANGSDTDGTIVSYVWTQTSGPEAASLTNSETTTVTVTIVNPGTYWFRATVTDNLGATGYAEARLIVNAASVNQPPVANAGTNKSITLPLNAITLTGTGSDPDGTISSYQWIKVSGPTATLANATTPNLSVSNMVEGTYVFRLTVRDNGGLTASAEATVSVLPQAVNAAPVANAGADKVLTLPTNSLNVSGTGSDADGSVVSYTWTKISGPAAVLSNANTPSLTVTSMVAGSYVFRLTVTDEDGAIDSDDVGVTVNPIATNQNPIANAGPDQTINLPTNMTTISGSGSDPDGSIAGYSWVKVSGPTVTTGATNLATLSLSNLVAGSYTFRLEVTDNLGAKASDDVVITVLQETVNSSPVVNAGADIIIVEPESIVSLSGSASDTDGSITSVVWTQVAGEPAIISTPATLFTEVTNLVVGTYRFRLTATDNNDASSFDEVVVTVNLSSVNQSPSANAGTDKTIKLPENSIVLTGTASDADGTIASYAWEKVSGPAVTISGQNTSTVALTNMEAGTYSFRLVVTDNQGATGEDFVLVNVLPGSINIPPTVNAGPDRSTELPENQLVLTGTAEDEDPDELILLWEKISGPNVTMQNTDQAALTLSNLVEGVYVFRFTAMDNGGFSDSDDVTVTVFPAPVETALPTVNAGQDLEIQLPQNSVTINVEADAPDALIVSYVWQQTEGLPVNFDPASENVLILENLTAGLYKFTLTVTDSEGRTASDDIVITVIDENPLVKPRKLFSPDQKGDVSTETWTIENAQLLDECEILVYDRQGQKVFSSIGYPVPWNGMYNGKPLPDGAYFYIIRCSGKVSKTGSVTIARLK